MTRRWLTRLARGITALLLLVLLAVFGARYVIRMSGEAAYSKAVEKLDQLDPGWRLDDILKADGAAFPPPEKNGAERVLAAAAELPAAWTTWAAGDTKPLTHAGLPALIPAESLVNLKTALAAAPAAVALARTLTAFPRGQFRVVVEHNTASTSLEHLWTADEVGLLLTADAALAAHDQDWPRVRTALHANLNAGRSVGVCRLSLINLAVRYKVVTSAVRSAERCLGWGLPADTLADLEAELLTEARVDALTPALRGERAMWDTLIARLDAGTVDINEVIGEQNPMPEKATGFWHYRAWLPADRAVLLNYLTAAITAARRPPPGNRFALRAVRKPPAQVEHLLSKLFTPNIEQFLKAQSELTAAVAAAAAGIACERYRLKFGKWPNTLADIPKDLLAEVPTDPFTGKGLLITRFKNGIVVHAATPGNDPGDAARYDPRLDIPNVKFAGFRLWDPAHRRQTPRP